MTQEAQLKACPNAEAIAQQIADRTRWKKSTDTYARIYQAAYAAAILTEQTRIESGVVAELASALVECENALADYIPQLEARGAALYYGHKVLADARAALAKLEASK